MKNKVQHLSCTSRIGSHLATTVRIHDQDGNLYGTAFSGGDMGACGGVGCGLVFKLDPTGNEMVLYNFKGGADGLEPTSSLIRDENGNLYGTTYEGGEFGAGTVFKLDSAGNETMLHSFAGGRDGANPNAGLVLEPEGNLYGTTALGGVNRACPSDDGCRTVFRVDTHGRASVLHRFTGRRGGGYPQASLILDRDRNLYGTTYAGGASDAGLVFQLKICGECDEDSAEESSTGVIEDSAAPATQNPTALTAGSHALRSEWRRFRVASYIRFGSLELDRTDPIP